MPRFETRLHRAASGVVAGLLGGLVWFALAGRGTAPLNDCFPGLSSPSEALAASLLMSAAIGAGFGLLAGELAITPGTGLMWAIAYGLLWWMIGPLTLAPLLLRNGTAWTVEAARLAFPALLGHLVGYGVVLGLAYWGVSRALAGGLRTIPMRSFAVASLRSMAIGGLAGIVGGLAFGAWMERVGFLPLVAGLVRSESLDVGRTLHLTISVMIGATYGLLFRSDIRGAGSSIAWGMAYGLIWWVIGPLTIMPWWLGQGVQWTLEAGQRAFPTLVGHIIYGVVLGIVYAMIDRLLRVLFIESDPLNREPEGLGTRSLRALGMGILASVAGGLAFAVVMAKTDALPVVASLIGRSSPTTGFVVHMVVSAIVGATYGLLFRREAHTYGAGLAWGLVYGLTWWFLGPLTLMPVLLGAELQWTLAAAVAAYPSLIGHLAYGAVTALTYQYLVRRYDVGWSRIIRRGMSSTVPAPARAAPALWLFVLVVGTTLPLILGG